MTIKKLLKLLLILIIVVAFSSTTIKAFAAVEDKANSKKDDDASPTLSEVIKDLVAPSQATTTEPVAEQEQTATTTPVVEPKEEPKTVEEVLNTVIPPRDTPQKNPPTKSTIGTTTPVAGSTDETPFQRLIGGITQGYSPTNYYSPLNSLSPMATYAFSFCAMVMGIAGAVCILRDPREATVWAPESMATSPLLEQ
ncbi:MAG: hypothetical protein V4519_05055 [Patescibacteria group bacterium]